MDVNFAGNCTATGAVIGDGSLVRSVESVAASQAVRYFIGKAVPVINSADGFIKALVSIS